METRPEEDAGEEEESDADAAPEDAAGPYRRISVETERAFDLTKELLPIVTTAPGSDLAVRLVAGEVAAARPKNAVLAAAALVLALGVFWLATRDGGHPTMEFMVIGVGLVALAAFSGRHFAGSAMLRKAKLPIVELAKEPVARGESVTASITQPGPVRFFSFRVVLVCEEQCEVHRGMEIKATTARWGERSRKVAGLLSLSRRPDGTRMDSDFRSKRVVEQVLFETHDLDVPESAPWRHRVDVVIERTAPVSFLARRFGTVWAIEVTSGFDRDSETTHVFPFRVLP